MMKNSYVFNAIVIAALCLFICIPASANTPSLAWRLNNPRIVDNNKFVFDIQVKSDLISNYDHGFARIFFNEAAFSNNASDFKEIRAGMSAHQVDGTYIYATNLTITTFESQLVMNADLESISYNDWENFFSLEENTWQTFMSIEATIIDHNELVNMYFAEESMHGQNYFNNGAGESLYGVPFTFEDNFTDLYLGRIYSSAGGGWTQYNGLDWSAPANTSIWDGCAMLYESNAQSNHLRLHNYDNPIMGTILSGLYIAPNAAISVQGDICCGGNNTVTNILKNTKDEAVTIAAWNFDTAESIPHNADDGISTNLNVAPFDGIDVSNKVVHPTAGFDSSPAAAARTWLPADDFFGVEASHWSVVLTTVGYEKLKISSKQINSEEGGPTEFELQYSFNGSTWTSIENSTVIVSNSEWTLTDEIQLPTNLDNKSEVHIRWYYSGTSLPTHTVFNIIDDIIITGDPLPVYSGIYIAADETGNGSLIHYTPGIECTLDKYFTGSSLDWHLLSSPVSNMAIAGSEFEPRHAAGDGADIYDTFYMWHESGWWLNYKADRFNQANSGDDFFPGRGYLVAYDFRESNTGKEINPIKSFQGNLSAGDINLLLDYGSDAPPFPDPDKDIYSTNKNWVYEEGWNLLGNPYPCCIDWSLADKTLFADNYAYVYVQAQEHEGISEGYHPVDGSVSGTGSYIDAHQGFFVLVEDPVIKNRDKNEMQFTFTDDMRVHGSLSQKDQIDEFDRLVLRLSSPENYFDATTINLRPGSDYGRDRSDARKLFGYNTDVPQLYSLTADNVQVAINAVPEITNEHNIPIGMYLPAQGEYVFRISDASGIFMDTEIYLTDIYTNTKMRLSESDGYEFSAVETGNYSNIRFIVSFAPPADDDPTGINGSTAQDTSRIWNHRSTLYVFTTERNAEIEIHSISGSRLVTYPIVAGEQSFLLDLAPGIYVVRLNGKSSLLTKKIVIQ